MIEEDASLLLAAEDFLPESFSQTHRFSDHDERTIRALMAQGPVLLRGGRGSGKSALMIEANRRLASSINVIGIYISLRYFPLLNAEGSDYMARFSNVVSAKVREKLSLKASETRPCNTVEALLELLTDCANSTGKRLVMFFDDAAHLGREVSLAEFFDAFRFLSTSLVSCKATIYPGITRFGTRFDVYNDAVVIDVLRDERNSGFSDFFSEILSVRNPNLFNAISGYSRVSAKEIAGFLGRTVLGNMRGFVFACNRLEANGPFTGLDSVGRCLQDLASEYYWPLLDELAPKLGIYEPLIEPARNIAEKLFALGAEERKASIIVHRDWSQSFAKPFEILEYAGFIAKREASKALRGGGRGPRYSLNLANLFEKIHNPKFSRDLLDSWLNDHNAYVEVPRDKVFNEIVLPDLVEKHDLAVLDLPIKTLVRSRAYPYGLTPGKIVLLEQAGLATIGNVANASDAQLLAIDSIWTSWLKRIRDAVNQAIWM